MIDDHSSDWRFLVGRWRVGSGELDLTTEKYCFVSRTGRPGGDLLSRGLSHSTMGAGGFHGRVRDGIGWGPPAKATRSSGPSLPGLAIGMITEPGEGGEVLVMCAWL